jgi:hypothetical protein
MSTLQSNYYSVTPAEVRYCKNLEPNAKLLYGEISALCNQEGFCWASNRHFSQLYDVDVRTIQRWLDSLQKNGFIVIHKDKNKFNSQRRIYLSNSFKIFTTEGQKCHPPMTKMSPIILKDNNTSNIIIAGPPKKMPAGGNNNFHKCLEKCEDLSLKQKVQISKFPEEIVAQAIRYAYHPTTKIQGGPIGRLKLIQFFIRNPDQFEIAMKNLDKPPEMKTKKDVLLGKFKKGEIYNGYEFIQDDIGVGFFKPGMMQPYSVNWNALNFEAEFLKLLGKLKIKPLHDDE